MEIPSELVDAKFDGRLGFASPIEHVESQLGVRIVF